MSWYIAKKKSEKRWHAYELDEKPEIKRGYEMKGPFDNLILGMIAANQNNMEANRDHQFNNNT